MMRIVVKIGTSSVTDEHGAINNHAIETLCNQVAQLREQSHEVLVVTSGAVAGGVAALGMSQRPTDTQTLQALAAVGQSQLMNRYNEYLSARGLIGAQVLLVPNDFIDRTQYLHARQTLGRLLELGCVPIINENDAIASDEIRFGDNDRIAALVAHSVGADALVLLTDIGGLYTADPRTDASATLRRASWSRRSAVVSECRFCRNRSWKWWNGFKTFCCAYCILVGCAHGDCQCKQGQCVAGCD